MFLATGTISSHRRRTPPACKTKQEMTALEIESEDVVRLVLQFLKENNLMHTMRALQAESDVSLNAVDSLEDLVADITHGRWESVIPQVSALALPLGKLVDLYEQIVLELLEMRETELARELLRSADPFVALKTEDPERYLRLEHFLQRASGGGKGGGGGPLDMRDLYPPGSSKEKRRAQIADALLPELTVVPPGRLLALMGQAIKYQYLSGALQRGQKHDLFRGGVRRERRDVDERPPRKFAGQIKFGAQSRPEAAAFAPDGSSVATGSSDGFVEVWDWESCKLRKDLIYQERDELMMHDDAVQCVAFSGDAESLATGSRDGKVKVWRISTGHCLRRFERAHTRAVASVAFARDASQLLTASHDETVKLLGLKSGTVLREFRGHASFVHCACFCGGGGGDGGGGGGAGASKVASASADGTVKVWDAKTAECLATFRPGLAAAGAGAGGIGGIGGGASAAEVSVHTVAAMPGQTDALLVCARLNMAHLYSLTGQLLRSYSTGKAVGGDLVCARPSPRGKWVYACGEDGILYCFAAETGELDRTLTVTAPDMEVAGLAHHPHRNMLATFGAEGILKLWKG